MSFCRPPQLIGPENMFILPDKLPHLRITRLLIVPSALVLVSGSLILVSIILRYFRRSIKLYIGLVVLSFTELLVFLQILAFYLLYLGGQIKHLNCGIIKSVGLFILSLPILAILGITASRYIFIKYPFSYKEKLCIRHQVLAIIAGIIFAFASSIWPALGFCDTYYDTEIMICRFHLTECHACYVFLSVYMTIIIIIPMIFVMTMYIWLFYIFYKLKIKYRQRKKCFSFNPMCRNKNDLPIDKRDTFHDEEDKFVLPKIEISEYHVTIVNKVTIDADSSSARKISVSTERIVTGPMFAKPTAAYSPATATHSSQSQSDTAITSTRTTPDKSNLSAEYLEMKKIQEDETKYPDIIAKTKVGLTSLRKHSAHLLVAIRKNTRRYSESIRENHIPWIIIVMVLMHVMSSTPWIVIEFCSDMFFSTVEKEYLLMDIVNACLLASVSCTPVLYIICTRHIRDKVVNNLYYKVQEMRRLAANLFNFK